MFGIVAALLGIVANTLFLDEYGSEWLPVTYLFIAGAGIVVSGVVARSAQRRSDTDCRHRPRGRCAGARGGVDRGRQR